MQTEDNINNEALDIEMEIYLSGSRENSREFVDIGFNVQRLMLPDYDETEIIVDFFKHTINDQRNNFLRRQFTVQFRENETCLLTHVIQRQTIKEVSTI